MATIPTPATDVDVLVDNLVSVIPDSVPFRVIDRPYVVHIEVGAYPQVRIRVEIEDLSIVRVYEFTENGVQVGSSSFTGREDRVTLGAQYAVEAAVKEMTR